VGQHFVALGSVFHNDAPSDTRIHSVIHGLDDRTSHGRSHVGLNLPLFHSCYLQLTGINRFDVAAYGNVELSLTV
jgi:hypothetical protein